MIALSLHVMPGRMQWRACNLESEAHVKVQAWPFSSFVALTKCLNLSEPQLSHLQIERTKPTYLLNEVAPRIEGNIVFVRDFGEEGT
jgi:hypothetical protein